MEAGVKRGMAASNTSTYSFEQLDATGEGEQAPVDLLAAAWADAAQIRERAYAQGHAAGMAGAQAELVPVVAQLVRALEEAARALRATREELVERLTREAAEVSLRIGEQIVTGAFQFQPELVLDVTRAAIRRLADRHRLTVLVNPSDLERISESTGDLRAELGGIDYMDVQADRRIDPGGAIVRTEYGEIDATITAQIENARAIVAAALVGDSSVGATGEDTTAEHRAAHDAV